MLEHHADIPPEFINVDLSVMKLDSIHNKLAIAYAFEPVDAAQQRAFSGAGWPHDDNDFPLGNGQVDFFQNMEGSEKFVDSAEFDQ